MKTPLFRVAVPGDYLFNSLSGCWELGFDKRPIAGTRCDSPEIGAQLYNAARAKFKSALCRNEVEQPIFEFVSLVEWVIDFGDRYQQEVVQQILNAICPDDMNIAVSKALKLLPRRFDFAYGFGRSSERIRVSIALRERLSESLRRVNLG